MHTNLKPRSMKYYDAIALLGGEHAALNHQVIIQSSSVFKGALKKIEAQTKYALEFVESEQTIEATKVRGFDIPAMKYTPEQNPTAELLDKGDRAWGHILKAAADVNANAIQRRLSSSAFFDPKRGHDLMGACDGLVGIKMVKAVSITKR